MKPTVIKSANPQPLAVYSEAMVAGPYIFTAGQLASDFKTGVPPEARRNPAFPYYGTDIKLQTRYILENYKRTFEAAGSSLNHVFKAQVFMTDLNDFAGFDEIWKQYFKVPPARTTIGTTGLLMRDALIEVDLIGYVPGKGIEMKAIKSDAPQPLAAYTEAFRIGDLIFCAGQLASDFKTGVPEHLKKQGGFLYYGSDIKAQTRFILENYKKTFEAAGSSLENAFKAQVFLTNPHDFNGFDEVWKEYFKVPPARSTIGTSGLLVKDTLIEIDLIGCVSPEQKIPVRSAGPQPIANYTEAFRIGDLVFAAGHVATDFKRGLADEVRRHPNFPYYGSDIKLQTRYVLNSLKRTFEAGGSSLDNIVKAQVFLTDLKHFSDFDEVWKEFFKVPPPRTTIGTSALLVEGALVEIDLIGLRS
jgi:enamine deaminase RidA (YjgF/YER057c/UK114 family)